VFAKLLASNVVYVIHVTMFLESLSLVHAFSRYFTPTE